MATKVYGASDDLIEFDGDVHGEVGCWNNGGSNNDKDGVLVACSDGTLLAVKYHKPGMGVWSVTLLHAGELFDHIDPCVDEDATPYSDVAHFRDGLKWAHAATEWERVK